MSFLSVTLPASLLLAAVLLALVIRAARQGQFDDWEGPAWRHFYDDDRVPEREGAADEDEVQDAEPGLGGAAEVTQAGDVRRS